MLSTPVFVKIRLAVAPILDKTLPGNSGSALVFVKGHSFLTSTLLLSFHSQNHYLAMIVIYPTW